MKTGSLVTFILATVCASGVHAAPVRLHITGDVDTTQHYTKLAIMRQNDTPRNLQAEMPVVDGKVDYVFETPEADRFMLVAMEDLYTKSSFIPMPFMAEDGEMHFSSKIDDRLLKMHIDSASGELNKRHMAYVDHMEHVYQHRLDSIRNEWEMKPYDEYYTPEAKEFWGEFKALSSQIKEYPDSLALKEQRNEMYSHRDRLHEERKMYTPDYYEYEDAYRAVLHEMFEDDMQTFASSDEGLYGLSVLIDYLDREEDKDRVIDGYVTYYQAPYANTIMGQRMDKRVTGYELSHIGGRYPDYTLPDADGKEHHIKDLIGGKLTLIDLWGSTCGPCRVNSRSIKPIYEDYKDRGFEVVGIAREYGDLNLFHKAVEKDGYPWMQLIELDDVHEIFTLHGIPGAMGGTFLVSPEGRILLINPSPDELRTFLSEWYDK